MTTQKPLDLAAVKELLRDYGSIQRAERSRAEERLAAYAPFFVREVERLRLGLRGIANRPCFSDLLGDEVDACGCPACSANALLGKE